MNEKKESSFSKLNSIDVNSLTEEKNKLTYLNWAHAVRVLQMHYPSSTWEVKRFDGMPFLKTELGYFVEVELTVEGKSLSQLHAVFDFRGKTIVKPSATDINSSIQRCLAKVIALHGLGLYIYAREDTPQLKDAAVTGMSGDIIDNILAIANQKMINEGQRSRIMSVILSSGFSDERVSKALSFYNIEDFDCMTEKQADDFLSKAEPKKAKKQQAENVINDIL